MISVLVCLSAWLVMSLSVARVSYRRARAKVLDTIEDRMDAVTVATIRSQAHRDGVNEARWMFFLYPVIVPAMMTADVVNMIVIGRPAKTVTETNWETANSLRETERRIEQLEDQMRHESMIADNPTGPLPHADCGVCKTKSYPTRTDMPLPPGYPSDIYARCTADTCLYGKHGNQGSHIVFKQPRTRYDAP